MSALVRLVPCAGDMAVLGRFPNSSASAVRRASGSARQQLLQKGTEGNLVL